MTVPFLKMVIKNS